MRSVSWNRSVRSCDGPRQRVVLAAAGAVMTVMANHGLAATTRTWNTTSGNWSVATDWTPGTGATTVPAAGDSVLFTNTDGINRVINYDYLGAAATLAAVTIDSIGSTTNSNILSMAANNLSATSEYVGYSGAGTNGTGVINQSGGTNAVISLYLAYNPSDKGYYNLTNTAALTVSGNEYIGYNGSATINQSGGTNTVSNGEFIGVGLVPATYIQSGGLSQVNQLQIGYGGVGSTAYYNLAGGTLSAALNTYIGSSSPGIFTQTAGAFNSTNGVTVGYYGTGTFNMTGGTMTAGLITVGLVSSGSITMTNSATITASGLTLSATTTGSGSFILSANNTLAITGGEIIGGVGSTAGTFTQTLGTNNVGGDLNLGENASASLYNMSQGNLTVSGNLNLGNNGNGTLNFTSAGGGAFGTVTGALNIGVGAGSTGHLTVTGGIATGNLSAGSINVGGTASLAGGSAVVTINPGGMLSTTGLLTVYNTSAVAINLNGGTLQTTGFNFGGTLARLNWTSGTFNTSSNIFVDGITMLDGFGPSLTLTTGKTLIVANAEGIGYASNGSVLQTGGVNNAALGFIIGGYLSAAVTGSYTLTGGTLYAPMGELFIAYNGAGQFNQSGGQATGGLLDVGVYAGSVGTINLSGSASFVVTEEANIGYAGTGVVIQTGGRTVIGSSTSAANLNLGATASGSGSYNLSGGSLQVNGNVAIGGYETSPVGIGLSPGPNGTGVLSINPTASVLITGTLQIFNTSGSSVILNGGSLTTGVLDTTGTPAGLNWSSGTLTITNTYLAFDAGASSASSPLGSSFNLGSGQTLVVSQNENIGGVGVGSLTITTGGLNAVSGNLTVNTGGTLNASGGMVQAGSIVQAGGTISGTLVNLSTFAYQSGNFSGRLINQGTITLNANFTTGGGIENDTVFTIPAGRTVTTGASGFDNLGTLQLNGGTLAGGTVINDFGSTLNGYGTIQSVLTNNGSMYIYGGPLTLNSASTSSGNILIASGSSLRGSALTNSGTITLNGGAITAPLTDSTSATLTGFGSVAGGFTSAGQVSPFGGTLTITTAWTNTGLIQLSNSGILSGAAITNTSTIEGYGEIAASVLDTSGIIRGQGGELIFAGAGCTISAAGQIQAPAGGTVLFVQGLAVNAGTIAISGGTFDNSAQPIVNTGEIEGTGTFNAGSWNSTAGSQINLTANTNLYGPLTSAGAIHLYGANITFFGNVIDNGTLKATAASAYYLGATGLTINGSYISDPSANYFNGLNISSTGSLTGGSGDSFTLLNGSAFINTGSVTNAGTITASAINNSGTLIQTGILNESGNFNNSGTTIIGGTQNWSHGTSFTNTAGTATFQSDAGFTGENLTFNISGGLVTFASTQHLASLTISTAGGARITGNGSGHRSVLYTPTLSIAGTLDLTNNDMDVQAGGSAALAAVTGLIGQAYTAGKWTGTGITSSWAASDSTHLTAVGVMLDSGSITNLDGSAVIAGDVLVKLTYYGDANLDGKVDAGDYVRTDNGDLLNLTGWANGDFNYDGVVNGSDYALIDNSFNTQAAQLNTQVANSTTQIAGSVSAVPEPATLSLISIAALRLLRRRRR